MSHWTRRHVVQAGFGGAALAAAPLARTADSSPTLQSLARAKGMHFGTAFSGRALADASYTALVRAQCGMIVPENSLKMPSIQPQPGVFNFGRGDQLATFAETNSLLMRGHCLLWHHPRWMPRWIMPSRIAPSAWLCQSTTTSGSFSSTAVIRSCAV